MKAWREDRRVRASLRLSGLPTGQTIGSFDFSFQPSVERSRNDRYQRGSILITTNKGIREWPEILAGDEVLATAVLVRLLHNSHVLDIKGRSYACATSSGQSRNRPEGKGGCRRSRPGNRKQTEISALPINPGARIWMSREGGCR